MKKLIQWGTVFLLLLVASTGMAQSNSEDAFYQNELVLKVDAISPAAGISFRVQNDAKVRALIFFATNFDDLAFGKRFYLDLSYLQYNDWITSKSLNTYWGVNLSLIFNNDEAIAPGFLLGTSYELDARFSIFGEAGLNAFVIGDVNGAYIGMFNTGVGMKVVL